MLEKIENQACVRNQQPIFEALEPWLIAGGSLLELASGTGQHGVYITQRLPQITWQLSEHPSNLELSIPWQKEAQESGLLPAIPLDISQPHWHLVPDDYDYGYCANLLHFISDADMQQSFKGMAEHLKHNGLLFSYGPINENGFTSDGNKALDAWLKADINPEAGIKELKRIQDVAEQSGFIFKERINLPANNVILVFVKG